VATTHGLGLTDVNLGAGVTAILSLFTLVLAVTLHGPAAPPLDIRLGGER
jgi:hypothetical protein